MQFNKRSAILSVVAAIGAVTVLGSSIQAADAYNRQVEAKKKEAVDAHKRYPQMSIGAGLVTTPQIIKGLFYRDRPVTISGGMGKAFGYERYHAAKNSELRQSMQQVFGDEPIFDSKQKRLSSTSLFERDRAYFNQSGALIQ